MLISRALLLVAVAALVAVSVTAEASDEFDHDSWMESDDGSNVEPQALPDAIAETTNLLQAQTFHLHHHEHVNIIHNNGDVADDVRRSGQRARDVTREAARQNREAIARAAEEQRTIAHRMGERLADAEERERNDADRQFDGLSSELRDVADEETAQRTRRDIRRQAQEDRAKAEQLQDMIRRKSMRGEFREVEETEDEDEKSIANTLDREDEENALADKFRNTREMADREFAEQHEDGEFASIRKLGRRLSDEENSAAGMFDGLEGTLSEEEEEERRRQEINEFGESVEGAVNAGDDERRAFNSLDNKVDRYGRKAIRSQRRMGKGVRSKLRRDAYSRMMDRDGRRFRRAVRRNYSRTRANSRDRRLAKQLRGGFRRTRKTDRRSSRSVRRKMTREERRAAEARNFRGLAKANRRNARSLRREARRDGRSLRKSLRTDPTKGEMRGLKKDIGNMAKSDAAAVARLTDAERAQAKKEGKSLEQFAAEQAARARRNKKSLVGAVERNQDRMDGRLNRIGAVAEKYEAAPTPPAVLNLAGSQAQHDQWAKEFHAGLPDEALAEEGHPAAVKRMNAKLAAREAARYAAYQKEIAADKAEIARANQIAAQKAAAAQRSAASRPPIEKVVIVHQEAPAAHLTMQEKMALRQRAEAPIRERTHNLEAMAAQKYKQAAATYQQVKQALAAAKDMFARAKGEAGQFRSEDRRAARIEFKVADAWKKFSGMAAQMQKTFQAAGATTGQVKNDAALAQRMAHSAHEMYQRFQLAQDKLKEWGGKANEFVKKRHQSYCQARPMCPVHCAGQVYAKGTPAEVKQVKQKAGKSVKQAIKDRIKQHIKKHGKKWAKRAARWAKKRAFQRRR